MKKSFIFSIGALVAFFLPWLTTMLITMRGYKVPGALRKFSSVTQIFSTTKSSELLLVSYVIYLVPLFALFNLIRYFSGQKRIFWLNEFICGLIAAACILYMAFTYHHHPFRILGIGFYLSLLCSVLGLAASMKELKEKEIIPRNRETILAQLAQLQSLKKDGMLTESIYEKQKAMLITELEKITGA